LEELDLPFLDSPTYKWIFVGGKGGVGKTSSSCAIASALSKKRSRVLLVSTDPASNIGDAFQQHFTTEPTLVNGYTNLYAMNTPTDIKNKSIEHEGLEGFMNFPGVDELQALAALFKSIEKNAYDVVVFDTAPTGHTMKFLSLPNNIKNIFSSTGLLGGGISSIASMLNAGGQDFSSEMDRTKKLLDDAAKRLTNPAETTFVCVTLPEFLPVYETERLIDFLADSNIETHTIIVNQLIKKENAMGCKFCTKRYENQQNYLKDIDDAYGEFFRIVKVPTQEGEIKGPNAIKNFADILSPIITKQ
jgi:arsenite-transporting ATPase